MTIPYPEVRFCQLCRQDDDTDELIKYSTRHYAHADHILEEARMRRAPSQVKWTVERMCALPTFPLTQLRDAAVADHNTAVGVVVALEGELRDRHEGEGRRRVTRGR